MAIVTLLIAVVLSFLWFLEVKVAQSLPPVLLATTKAAGVIVLYFLFVRITGQRKNNSARAGSKERSGNGAMLVAYASQTGAAEEVARRTAKALEQGGAGACLVDFSVLDIEQLRNTQTALFIASTTGEGEPPDAAGRFFAREMASSAALTHLRYAVLALGDKNYREFCAFGRRLEGWLKQSGAEALFARIDVDCGDEQALAKWFHDLEGLGAAGEAPAYRFETWRLAERSLLNPGSENPPVYHVSLTAFEALPNWCAGDIAVVSPQNSQSAVEESLLKLSLDGVATVIFRKKEMALNKALGHLVLPIGDEITSLRHMAPQTLVDRLHPIPPREYSLASLPADGSAELVIRQMRHPDGRLGAGSGWLTEYASQGSKLEMRVRRNSSFHGPQDDRPMILIGAGSGMAGLRAHMKERVTAGRNRNWLIFGERNAQTDYFFCDEIEAWCASDAIVRLDLCFMENGAQKLVQDALRENENELRRWLKNGAAIYVSGSRSRIGDGVKVVLEDLIGADKLNALRESGRYRADVY